MSLKKFHIKKHFIACFAFVFFVLFQVMAQRERGANIVLEHAETLTFDRERDPNIQILSGNVRFRHEGMLMFCDSAFFNMETNSMDAFGNVRMVQGDTLFVYSDVLFYCGNTRIARLRQNVRMINNDVVLTTDYLDYNRETDIAFYFNGGELRDPLNVLTSERGYYFVNQRIARFHNNVVLTNENLVITSDTLRYNTLTRVAYLFGPSNITSEDGHIFTELGSYNTETQYALLFNRSQVETRDGRFLTADTISYDRATGIGRVFSRAELRDTTQNIIIRGNFGIYNEIKSFGFFTDSALVIEYSAAPDSLFLHADSLFFERYYDNYNLLRAFNNVRFFRSDIQGKSDSLTYSSRSAIMTMHYEPVLWSESGQMSGDIVHAFIAEGSLDSIHVVGNAMVVMQDEIDDFRFNQLVGREIRGHVRDNELYRIIVDGNAESIYHPREGDGTLVGVNRTESPLMIVHLRENQLERIVLFPGASGRIMPDENLQREDVFFPRFAWHDDIRPRRKEDVFIRTEPPVRVQEDRRRRRR